MHEVRKNYKCDSCSNSYLHKRGLKNHIQTVHEGTKVKFKCDFCGKSLTEPHGLKLHILAIHEGRKDYKCDYCSHKFSSKGTMKRHIYSVHQGKGKYDEPVNCKICNYLFKTKSGLRVTFFNKGLGKVN